MSKLCMCEHIEHDDRGGCRDRFLVVVVFDGTPVPLCRYCVDRAHMGIPDADQTAARVGG